MVRIEERSKANGYDSKGKYDTGILIQCDSAMDLMLGDDGFNNVWRAAAEFTGKSLPAKHTVHRTGNWNGHEWFDNRTAKESFEEGAFGSEKYLPQVQKVMDEVEAALGDTEGNRWVRSRAGMLPCVPSAIAGRPLSMYDLRKVESDRAPVTVWYNAVSSAGWDAGQLAPRGAAVAAMLLKLAESRPVALNVVMMVGRSDDVANIAVVIPCNVQTMNVSQLAAMLCSSGWHRWQYELVCESYSCALWDCDGSWDSIFTKHGRDVTNKKFIADAKRFLGAAEQDLYIPQAYLRDEMVTNPVAWVKRTLATYAETQEEWQDAA